MPTASTHNKKSSLSISFTSTILKPADRFADFHSLITFPKECITSKMIQLTGQNETFLVSCLKGDPLVFVKDYKLIRAIYQKNDLVPMKPIQRLNSFAESGGALVISHGDHNLEFSRIFQSHDGEFGISRFCQKAVEKGYRKILFKSDSDAFLAQTDTQIDLFDYKRISKIGSIESRGVVQDFDTCPANSSIFAYTDGYLNVVDGRTEGKQQQRHQSLYKHKNESNLVRWNPIVPYWLATSSTDSLNIFDIRYNSATPVLSIQHSNIHELCWSPINCDLILAASRDRRTNLWSLRHSEEDDCRLSMTINRFDLGSLAAASNASNHFFYGLDDADSLVKIKIRLEYLKAIAPASTTEYKEIEDAIYSANYDNFKTKLTEMSQEAFKDSDYSKLKRLILLAMPVKSHETGFDEKSISTIQINDNLREFKNLLTRKTSANNNTSRDSLSFTGELRNFIDKLRLKIRVIELMSSGDFDSIEKFLHLVTAAISEDLNFFDGAESIKFMAFLLKNNRPCALSFLLKISSSFSIGTPKKLQIWIWMACFPTIFDTKSFDLIKIRPSSLSKSISELKDDENNDSIESTSTDDIKIETFLFKQRAQFHLSIFTEPTRLGQEQLKIINQLYLNLCTNGDPNTFERLIKTEMSLLKENETILEEVQADLLNGNDSIFIISAQLIKNILERSLRISSKQFLTNFFLLAFRLDLLTRRTPINLAIKEFIATVGFSRFKFLLSSSANCSVVLIINSIVAIGTDLYCNFSNDQYNFLAEQLNLLIGNITDFSSIKNLRTTSTLKIKHRKFKMELENLKYRISK